MRCGLRCRCMNVLVTRNCCGLTTTTTTSTMCLTQSIITHYINTWKCLLLIRCDRLCRCVLCGHLVDSYLFIHQLFVGLDYDNLKCCHRTIIQPLIWVVHSFLSTHIDYHAYLFPLFSVSFNYIFLYLTFLSCLYRSSRLSFLFVRFGLVCFFSFSCKQYKRTWMSLRDHTILLQVYAQICIWFLSILISFNTFNYGLFKYIRHTHTHITIVCLSYMGLRQDYNEHQALNL